YECLAGRRPFRGDTPVQTLSAILDHDPPPLGEAAPGVLQPVVRIVERCLAKDASERFQSARDLAFALEVFSTSTATGFNPAAPAGHRAWRIGRRVFIASLVAALAAAGILGWRSSFPLPSAQFGAGSLMQLTVDPGYEGTPAFAPDGRTLAYVSERDGNFEIYLQQISGGPAINLTRNPAADVQPAFSPDGREIAFVSTRASTSDLIHAGPGLPMVGGDIWVMPALGGPAKRIVEGGNYPAWSPDGSTIVYVRGTFRNTRLALVPATGGPEREIPIDEPFVGRYFWPSISRDGRWVLYQNSGQMEVVPVTGGRPRVLGVGTHPSWGRGSESVIFTNNSPGKSHSLWQAPFSLARGELLGPAEPLTFGRGMDTDAQASPDGATIAFAAVDDTLNLEEMPFDPEAGRATGPARELTHGSNRVAFFDPAPHGEAVVFAAERGAGLHIWRVDPPAAPVQLTFGEDQRDGSPRWSPDGREIAFQRSLVATTAGRQQLWLMSADGGNPRQVGETDGNLVWLPDSQALIMNDGDSLALYDLRTRTKRRIEGANTRTLSAVDEQQRWVVFQTGDRGTIDLAAVPIGGGTPRVVVASPREDYHPFFSPSGRWLYFQPDHKNIMRVPGPAQDWRTAAPQPVTSFGGPDLYLEDPRFSRDGRKLFYARGRTTGDIWVLRLPATAATR
ncbi:MAG: hypothetical protein ACM3H9_04555, partial [Rhodospirillaceae bacterium]